MIRAIVFLLLFSYLINSKANDNSLIITQITEDDPFTHTAKDIIRNAYQKIGINIQFLKLPAERALALTNQAITDGELFRINNINMAYPNLVKIPTSYIDVEHMAFSNTKNFIVNGWKSLKPYRICFTVGYKAAEGNTQGFDITLVNTDKQAFQMLNINRVDIVITTRIIGINIINQLAFKRIKMLTPPIQVTPLFHYIHKKHKKLLPSLDTALQSVKQDRK